MVSRKLRTGLLMILSLGVLMTAEAYAQTGAVRGTLVDDKGQPIESAQVVIQYQGGVNREFRATTNENGSFIRVGLQPGEYKLLFSKEGYQPMEMELRVRIGDPTDLGQITLPEVSAEMKAAQRMQELNAAVADEFKAGIAAAEAEDYQGAIASFQKVLEINPESAEAHFNIGFAHSKLGHTAEAEAAYQKAIEYDPSTVEAYVELSSIYSGEQKWAEALEMLKKAVEIQPNDTRYQYNLGAVALNSGNMDVAEAAFRKILELDPSFPMAHYQLGMVDVNKGKNAEAIAEFEKYLELEPEGANAATATGIINHLKQQQN